MLTIMTGFATLISISAVIDSLFASTNSHKSTLYLWLQSTVCINHASVLTSNSRCVRLVHSIRQHRTKLNCSTLPIGAHVPWWKEMSLIAESTAMHLVLWLHRLQPYIIVSSGGFCGQQYIYWTYAHLLINHYFADSSTDSVALDVCHEFSPSPTCITPAFKWLKRLR